MDETNINETTPDILPDDHIDNQTDVLDSDYSVESGTGDDSELLELEDTTESEFGESVSMGDSTSYILTYSEEQQQIDVELVGGIDKLNGTCTLILFFLLFAWVDKKVRFFTKGFTDGKSN